MASLIERAARHVPFQHALELSPDVDGRRLVAASQNRQQHALFELA
jgi:hypothetical protein